MNPQVRHAKRACEAAKARQAVVVFIDEAGQYAVTSYGTTKAECAAVKPLCNAIADAMDEGELPMPGEVVLGGRRPSERQREFDAIVDERDECYERMQAAEKKLKTVAMLISIYERQRENEPEEGWPEGDLSPRQVLVAIAETIGQEEQRT
jgi:hypothetical protein